MALYRLGLADAVHPADALLQPHRVPGDVIVDDHMAELQIQTFTAGIGGNQKARRTGKRSPGLRAAAPGPWSH